MNELHSPIIFRWCILSGVAGLCLAAALSCTPGRPLTPPVSAISGEPSASTAAPPTVSPSEVAEQQATQAYVDMWQSMAFAGETSNWQAPELAEYATGNALTTITRSLYADHFNHVISRGGPVDHPTVSSVDPTGNPTTVRIADCGDSTHWLQYREGTTQLVDGTPGGRRSITAEVMKQPDGSWKVDQFAVEGLGSC